MRVGLNWLAGLAVMGLCACGAAASAPVATVPPLGGLPGLPALSELHGLSAVENQQLDVLSYIDGAHVAAAGADLAFTAPADGLAWAIYRFNLPTGTPLAGVAGLTGPLWVLAADFTAGHWVWTQAPAGNTSQVDYPGLGTLTDGSGFAYLAVVCPPGQTATLELLELLYDSAPDYGLTAEGDADWGVAGAVLLSWETGTDQVWRIYRSTVPQDPAPYLIGEETNIAPVMQFMDPVWADPGDGVWVAHNNDHGTPGDPADDFPWIAPAVQYYYRVVPVNSGVPGDASAEATATVPWGARRAAARAWPPTMDTTRVLADQLLTQDMTTAQIAWCATHLAGTQKIFSTQAAEFRSYNPDFLVLGYHLGVGAGEIGNVCGPDWDNDADWPYVDQHEDWLLHRDGSTQPAERVLQLDWDWYVADPSSAWQQYLAARVLEGLGEDRFDGWFIDSCAQPWNTDPDPWWPEGETMFGFWTPRLHQMLRTLTRRVAQHPLTPAIIPNAGQFVTTVSDIKYYGADWACAGVMVEGYGRWSPGSHFDAADWVLECNQILDHQAHGLLTILQCDIDESDAADRLFQFATYLMVRGERTYINWLGWGQSGSAGQWYPEFDWNAGAPVDGNPAAMSALADQGVYRREFANGLVVVNPTDAAVSYDLGGSYEAMQPSGGGNIDAAGATSGSLSWSAVSGTVNLTADSALVLRK